MIRSLNVFKLFLLFSSVIPECSGAFHPFKLFCQISLVNLHVNYKLIDVAGFTCYD